MEAKKIYCKKCRFLRILLDPNTKEPIELPTFFGESTNPIIHVCIHPSNITCRSNYLEYSGLGYKHDPYDKNQNNSCADFETAEEVVGHLNNWQPIPVNNEPSNKSVNQLLEELREKKKEETA